MYDERFKVKGHDDFQMPLKIEIAADSVRWGYGEIDIAMRGIPPNPSSSLRYWVTGLEMEEYDIKDEFKRDYLFRLDYSCAQYLMDGLWRAGVRPSNDEGNEGALSATKSHLEDMRTLVFDKGE